MPSQNQIINDALHHLGEPESSDPLNDESSWVVRVRDRLASRTQALFERHYWNFATTVQQLTASDPEPDGWDYGFNKPVKCWCIILVADTTDPRARGIDYDDRAGRLCTNYETTYLHFVDGTWATLYGSWPQVFADAVAAEIAKAVAPVTMSGENRDRLDAIARDMLRTAKNWDAIQTRHTKSKPSAWQRGRLMGRSSMRANEDG